VQVKRSGLHALLSRAGRHVGSRFLLPRQR